MACFLSAFFSSPTVYPNAVAWSEENLVAVACGGVVIILNPHNPKVRGLVTVPSSKRFPVGKIDGGGIPSADLLNGCLLPYHLSRETRPCVRSIYWSPVGLANNAGCLLAVCTTDGHVNVYCRPHCSMEWLEAVDISGRLYNYYKNTNFGKCGIVPSEGSEIVQRQDNADHEHTQQTSLRNDRKRRRQNAANVVTREQDLGEKNYCQIVPVSFYEDKPPEELTEDSNLPLITAQQYISRNEMLMSLTVAWSPIVKASGDDIANPHNSSSYSSILAVGGRCGIISLWRVRAPDCYSNDNTGYSGEVSLVGLLKAHDSWITAINWAEYESNVSKAQFLLVTGSSDGSLKIWQVNVEDLLRSSEVNNDSISLLKEVGTVDSAPISVLSLIVPSQSPWKLLLAIGKGSGSFECWTLDASTDKFENVCCYNAHDRTVAGLAWGFDGRCLYSCSQDNSMKSWVLIGDSLREVPIPLSGPGLKSCPDLSHALDSCFGLAISPGNLAIAVVRRYDADLLDSMYEGRSHKASIEFLWIGGQRLDLSSITSSEISNVTFPEFPENELVLWEANLLWSLNQYENPRKLLNILDIVSALLAFKQSAPKFVEHILLKWLASCLGSDFEISPTSSSEVCQSLPKLSSRQLQLINIISRRVVLKELTIENLSGKEHILEGLSDEKKESMNLWVELLFGCENELLKRLVSISFSAHSSLPSNSSEKFSKVGGWSPDGLPQMEQWVLQNEKNVKDCSKFLAAEIEKIKKRKSLETSKHEEVAEYCNYCSAPVPFESTEHATCSGAKHNNGVHHTHKLQRCAVTMQILPTKSSWYCMCCQRWSAKPAPSVLFTMLGYPSDFKSSIECSWKDTSKPCCPFCGILLHKSQPQYFLSPSPL